jgi:subtilisin-like proprotein convertase family protein
VSTSITDIGSVTVDLNISGRDAGGSGMFNGDLYVTLVHSSGFSVLLNRVGRDDTSLYGYADQFGFNIKISDSAALGDVHVYRVTLSGNPAAELTGPLTGTWAPDGRLTDPASVKTSDPRSALLGSFTGTDANGTWTLFVADVSAGGTCKLNSWGLEITPVPEPALCSMMTSLILVVVTALKAFSPARRARLLRGAVLPARARHCAD